MASRSLPRSASRESVTVVGGGVSGKSIVGSAFGLRRRYEPAMLTATAGRGAERVVAGDSGALRDSGGRCASRAPLEWHGHQPNPEAPMFARSSSLGLLAAVAISLPSDHPATFSLESTGAVRVTARGTEARYGISQAPADGGSVLT